MLVAICSFYPHMLIVVDSNLSAPSFILIEFSWILINYAEKVNIFSFSSFFPYDSNQNLSQESFLLFLFHTRNFKKTRKKSMPFTNNKRVIKEAICKSCNDWQRFITDLSRTPISIFILHRL